MTEPDDMLQDPTEITVHNMNMPAACMMLGKAAVASLSSDIKRVAFFIDDAGNVRMANPVYVYLDPRATVEVPENVEVRRGRQIITDGKPLHVEVDESGHLWEVEIIDKTTT
jgi:hypothetical protein